MTVRPQLRRGRVALENGILMFQITLSVID